MVNFRQFFILALPLLSIGFGGCAVTQPQPTTVIAVPRSSDATISIDYLPALKGDYFRLDSQEVNRPYHVYVRFPENYEPTAPAKYPVVYVLDGDSLFPILAPTHLFLHYDEKLPEAIIVGISYGGFDPAVNKRSIDFSAPGADTPPGHGGAPRFLQFLRKELLPQVESRYRIDPTKRVLLGQSRGGTFVIWSALEDPDLFWGRIASNPSLTPGRDRFFSNAAAYKSKDLNLIIASGSRDIVVPMDNALQWTKFWDARTDAPWTIRHVIIPEGTHAASIGEIYRQSMTWLFRGAINETKK